MAEGSQFSTHFREFTAGSWQRVEPPGLAPMPGYVTDAVTGLLMPESLAGNPLPAPPAWAVPAPGVSPSDLRIEREGRVVVLPGPAGDRPLSAIQGEVPAGQVVVIAYSSDGEAVLGWPRAGVQMVPVPPPWMAEIIGATDGYAPGAPVTFLVSALGRTSPGLALPEQYLQQVADLLAARVMAVTSEAPTGDLSEATAVFDPAPSPLERRPVAGGGVRVVSMRPQLQTEAELDRLAGPEGALEAEVFVEAFGDGSLGLHYQADPDDQEGRAYPVSPWFVAATLVPVLRGRPFVIRAVPAPGTQVSQTRLEATIAEIHVRMALLTGGDTALAAQSAAARRALDRDEAHVSLPVQAQSVVRRRRDGHGRRAGRGAGARRAAPLSAARDQVDQELRTMHDLELVIAPLSDRVRAAAARRRPEERERGKATRLGPEQVEPAGADYGGVPAVAGRPGPPGRGQGRGRPASGADGCPGAGAGDRSDRRGRGRRSLCGGADRRAAAGEVGR